MSAYVIVDVEVIDSVGYARYREQVPPTIDAFGGRYLVRGGAFEVREGNWSFNRCVVLEFPSMAQAKAWYDSPTYAPLREIRLRTTKSKLMIVEGL